MFWQASVVSRGLTCGRAFALFVMLQWCAPHGIDLGLYPNLDDYESRIFNRPAVQAALSAEGGIDLLFGGVLLVCGRHRSHRPAP